MNVTFTNGVPEESGQQIVMTRLLPLPDLVISFRAMSPVEINPPKVPRILWNPVRRGMFGTCTEVRVSAPHFSFPGFLAQPKINMQDLFGMKMVDSLRRVNICLTWRKRRRNTMMKMNLANYDEVCLNIRYQFRTEQLLPSGRSCLDCQRSVLGPRNKISW